MKVLWFAVTPSMYAERSNSHNGGGWISSLEQELKKVKEVELAIAFHHSDTIFKVINDGVTYYPMSLYPTFLNKLRRKAIFTTEENIEMKACLKIIDDFKPDIIHVFGTEWSFGLIAKYIQIPVVIHIQGLAHPYMNAYLPPSFSKIDFLLLNRINIKNAITQLWDYYFFRYRAEREIRIFKCNKYFMGRTSWDKSIATLFAPNATYFYCSEMLRSSFIETKTHWTIKEHKRAVLVTTISSPLYKGIDVLIKAAKLLKENTEVDFEWRVFGVTNAKFVERKVNILAKNVNVSFLGVISADQLKEELIDSDLFIHPSYIDNSPNSVCEAQILGVPIISTDVGGIKSLIQHNETGILVPANDPYSMASSIIDSLKNKEKSLLLGQNARQTATIRHDRNTIRHDLLAIYNKILS